MVGEKNEIPTEIHTPRHILLHSLENSPFYASSLFLKSLKTYIRHQYAYNTVDLSRLSRHRLRALDCFKCSPRLCGLKRLIQWKLVLPKSSMKDQFSLDLSLKPHNLGEHLNLPNTLTSQGWPSLKRSIAGTSSPWKTVASLPTPEKSEWRRMINQTKNICFSHVMHVLRSNPFISLLFWWWN